MLINKMFLFLFMYFSSLLTFSLKCNHLILMLLSLEFIIISLYFGIYMFLIFYFYEYNFMVIFLTLVVCESALGLAILVSLIRSYGNDYFNSFNILW